MTDPNPLQSALNRVRSRMNARADCIQHARNVALLFESMNEENMLIDDGKVVVLVGKGKHAEALRTLAGMLPSALDRG